jgi:CRISPR/Cas system CMR subunit Cmr4 (Cas7 group RAMP superfamily)
MQTLLEVLKLTIPGMLVFLTTYLLFKEFFQNQHQIKALEIRQNNSKTTLPLRLQAYERLSLFCERIAIYNLIMRLRTSTSTNQSLQYAMMLSIQQEFEHNISQQIYVSDELWKIIKMAKDAMVDIVTFNAQNIDPEGNSEELIAKLIAYLNLHPSPNDTAISAIRSEAASYF